MNNGDIISWKEDPRTKYFLSCVQEMREYHVAGLVAGNGLHSLYADQIYAEQVGILKAIDVILKLDVFPQEEAKNEVSSSGAHGLS